VLVDYLDQTILHFSSNRFHPSTPKDCRGTRPPNYEIGPLPAYFQHLI